MMTQKELFMALLGLSQVQAQPELVEGLQKRLDMLAQKSTSSKASGPSKAELALRSELETQTLALLQRVGKATCSELATILGTSTQKLAPRLKALVEGGQVLRVVEGKQAFFCLPED